MIDKELKPLYAELKGYLEQLPKEVPFDEVIEEAQIWEQYNARVDSVCKITGIEDYSNFKIEPIKIDGVGLPLVRLSAYRQKLGGITSRLKAEYFSNISMRFAGVRQMKTNSANRPFWDLLHPKIVKIAKSRFESGHLADSVESAFKEVNKCVKDIVKNRTGQELDGAPLMNKTFSLDAPIIVLSDLTTETGKNIQKGYLQIFAGAMTGIRNPKAHDNLVIDENRAFHLLSLASLLMFKVDERVY